MSLLTDKGLAIEQAKTSLRQLREYAVHTKSVADDLRQVAEGASPSAQDIENAVVAFKHSQYLSTLVQNLEQTFEDIPSSPQDEMHAIYYTSIVDVALFALQKQHFVSDEDDEKDEDDAEDRDLRTAILESRLDALSVHTVPTAPPVVPTAVTTAVVSPPAHMRPPHRRPPHMDVAPRPPHTRPSRVDVAPRPPHMDVAPRMRSERPPRFRPSRGGTVTPSSETQGWIWNGREWTSYVLGVMPPPPPSSETQGWIWNGREWTPYYY